MLLISIALADLTRNIAVSSITCSRLHGLNQVIKDTLNSSVTAVSFQIFINFVSKISLKAMIGKPQVRDAVRLIHVYYLVLWQKLNLTAFRFSRFSLCSTVSLNKDLASIHYHSWGLTPDSGIL